MGGLPVRASDSKTNELIVPGTKSISEVRDLYDLIDLYANLDRSGDGLIGAGEMPAEEISKTDVGSTPYEKNRPDGFLAPWEIMQRQARFFGSTEVAQMRTQNQASLGSAFSDIMSLPKDVAFGPLRFKVHTALRFWQNGRIQEATLAEPTDISVLARQCHMHTPPDDGDLKSLPAGTRIWLDPDGTLKEIELGGPAHIRGIDFTAGIRIRFKGNKKIGEADATHEPIVINNIAYTRVVFLENGDQVRTLKDDTSVPFLRLVYSYNYFGSVADSKTSVSLPCKAKTDVRFNPDRFAIQGVLAQGQRMFEYEGKSGGLEVALPPGTKIHVGDGSVTQFRAELGDDFRFQGVHAGQGDIFEEISERDLEGMIDAKWYFTNEYVVRLRSNHGSIRIGGVHATEATIDAAGVVWATLAGDFQSPYGSGRVYRAGENVFLSADGRFLEPTMKCFETLYPGIKLFGVNNANELLHILTGMAALPPAIRRSLRKVSFVDDFDYSRHPDIPWFASIKGEADPVDIGSFRLSRYSSLQGSMHPDQRGELRFLHEAAHVHTLRVGEEFKRKWLKVEYSLLPKWIQERLKAEGLEINNTIEACITEYGCRNFYEDVATMTEAATFKPTLFRRWIDPGVHRHAPAFRAKLDLLREYGFITEAKYREIVPVHPGMAAFCQAVNCP